MRPVNFSGADRGLTPPPGREHDCGTLPTQLVVSSSGAPACYSCWELTEEELLLVMQTRRVWLLVEGRTHAPIILSGHDIREAIPGEEDGD